MKPFKRLGLLSQTLRKLHSGRVTAKGYSKPDSDPTNSRKQLEIRAREILRGAFGHEEFRKNQLEPILRTCEGLRSLVILPTSGGKSAIFQIAGIMLEGTTLVISPLISLMDVRKGSPCVPLNEIILTDRL